MAGKKRVIETGVDKLVRLVAERKKISVKDAAKELGVSVSSIEDWADFLEEEGIISIQTQFATVYLVEKRISKKELEEKVRSVKEEKELFMKRVESSINSLARDHEEIKLIDCEFKNIKGVLESNFSKLHRKLEKLEDFRKSHRDIELKRKGIEDGYGKKIGEMEGRLKKEQKEYHDVLDSLNQELEQIKKERESLTQMRASEKELQSKVGEINHMLEQVKKEIDKENQQISVDEERLKRSEDIAKKVKQEIESDSKELEDLSRQVKISRKELDALENEFVKDLDSLGKGDLEKIGSYKDIKQLIEKFKSFFDQSKEVDLLIQSAEKEDTELSEHFAKLLKKAQAFSVMTSAPEVKKEVEELHKELEAIESKKALLASQLKKLRAAVRSVIK
ncbi:hypothetical protein JW898_02325 [Candidatus Woesearchaeota archaeon]|nr:hypothetical protein [Candidatus Woesearchaeota archaeon]